MPAPASAAGPDLRQLVLGSEGAFGVITQVRVRIHPTPATTRYEAWSFPDFATGADALRAVVELAREEGAQVRAMAVSGAAARTLRFLCSPVLAPNSLERSQPLSAAPAFFLRAALSLLEARHA